MGEIRDNNGSGSVKYLLTSERDASHVQQHIQSAGDELIKQLARKQTDPHTTLEQQLSLAQNFVPSSEGRDATIEQNNSGSTSSSIQELSLKTGLSRDELESFLSIKPNSDVAKLYKFALSNQCAASSSSSLLSKLPDHPLNNLKKIEEEFMKEVHQHANKGSGEDNLKGKKRKKKHRTRKKKILVEQTCELPPGFTTKNDVDITRDKLDVEFGCTSNEGSRAKSLWDVKDVKSIGCRTQKIYTVRDGQIEEVSIPTCAPSTPSE